MADCPSCAGTVRLKLSTCAIHGTCTERTPVSGHGCCTGCTDYAAAPINPGAGTVRHLLYHVCPLARDGGRVWRWNVAKLRRRLSLFNGRRVVGIATGPGTDPASAVREDLAGCGCEFVEAANDPALREVTTFHALHERVAAYTGPGDVTFFGHAKGVSSEDNPSFPGVRRWAEALYSTCLDHWPAVARLLRTHPLAGPFKRLGHCFPESPTSAWHYSGSWRWFRNADLFARDWRKIDRAWIGVESHPSLHFRADEAACIFHEFADPGLALYTEAHWRDRAGPALAFWHEEHLADRWGPLLLTCILTSHRKPRRVHDAIGSVLAQTCPDWQLLVLDSGDLAAAGEFNRYRGDVRVRVEATGEAESGPRGQGWAINEAFRRGLVLGDLACYLSDDDVLGPGIFGAWLDRARSRPGEAAWYGPCSRVNVGPDGRESPAGELSTVGLGGRGGTSLDNRADGMQVAHRAAVRVPWPEDPAVAWHADGVFLDALGGRATIHPIAEHVGRHRHCPESTFTRPSAPSASFAPSVPRRRALLPDSAWQHVFGPLRGKRVGYVPLPGNVGDHLIEAGTFALLARFGITWSVGADPTADLLLVAGGGSMGSHHSGQHREGRLEALAAGPPVWVLPQSWMDRDPEADAGRYARLFARDALSLAYAPAGTELAPDLALALDRLPHSPATEGPGTYLRRDCEARFADHPSLGDPVEGCAGADDYLARAARHSEVVTDRLHFAIAALLCGRQATLLPGTYHKARGAWEYSLAALGCCWADVPEDDGCTTKP